MPDPVVVAQNLQKSFGALQVVKGVDFEIRDGECFGILGPNGAGKTTTIGMLICFLPIGGGELHLFGLDARRNPRTIKGRIGVVPQEDDLDPDLSVGENLVVFARYFGIPKPEAKLRAADLIRFMQLASKRDAKISHLSGGLKRRLTIARALVNRPEFLVLDEPTTGLDPQARLAIWNKLRSLKQTGTTMLLTTHYMEEAQRLCDRIMIMDNGTVLATGTPDELIRTHVGEQVLEYRLERAEHASQLCERLRAAGHHVEMASDNVYVFLPDGDTQAAIASGGEEKPFLQRRANLEDVFVRLTGRDIRE